MEVSCAEALRSIARNLYKKKLAQKKLIEKSMFIRNPVCNARQASDKRPGHLLFLASKCNRHALGLLTSLQPLWQLTYEQFICRLRCYVER